MRAEVENIIGEIGEIKTFQWGIMPEFNLLADHAELPLAFMIPPVVFRKAKTTSQYLSTYMVTVLFLKQTQLSDAIDTTKYEAIKEMRELANTFTDKMVKKYGPAPSKTRETGVDNIIIHSPNPDDKTDINAYFNLFDTNLSGVGVTMDVSVYEKATDCWI